MGRPANPIGKASTLRRENHLDPIVGRVSARLFHRPQGGEGSIAADDRQLATQRQPGGNTSHVLLGDPQIKQPARELRAKRLNASCVHKVGSQNDEIRVCLRQRQHGFAKLLPNCLLRIVRAQG